MIFVHDCNPPDREHEANVAGEWNGDVWKVAFIMNEEKKWKFFTLNCDWGLGVISGFNPGKQYEVDPALVDKAKQLDYDYLEKHRKKLLNLRHPFFSRLFF